MILSYWEIIGYIHCRLRKNLLKNVQNAKDNFFRWSSYLSSTNFSIHRLSATWLYNSIVTTPDFTTPDLTTPRLYNPKTLQPQDFSTPRLYNPKFLQLQTLQLQDFTTPGLFNSKTLQLQDFITPDVTTPAFMTSDFDTNWFLN